MLKIKKMKKIIYIILITSIFASCRKTDDFLPPIEFNYPIPQVDITENVIVGAYYYNYSTSDWNKKYTNTPTLGTYTALDPATMSQHRIWADAAGVDYFIFPWNGTSNDTLLNNFKGSRTETVRMVINYNTAHLGATNSSPLAGAKLTNMITELKTHASNHFNNDYYFKVDNHPVIIITPINLSSGAASSIDYKTVISTVRTELNTVGVDPYIIGEITLGWIPPQRYSAALKSFDAVVLKDWKADGNYGYDRSVFFQAFADQSFKNWNDSTTAWGINYIPCILPGFDDKTMSPASKNYNLPRSADFFTDMCNVAKRNMGTNRIVAIDSWNHFQYGTTVEPTEEYETDYLDTTKEQFKVNR